MKQDPKAYWSTLVGRYESFGEEWDKMQAYEDCIADCFSRITTQPRVYRCTCPSTCAGVPVFSRSRKIAQQTAHHLISGHLTLIAWWTLKNAGILDAILKAEANPDSKEGPELLVHATRASLAPEVLYALVDYLHTAKLLAVQENKALFTPEGKALFEHEDGLLELVRSYEPVVDIVEHMLAKLKPHGGAVLHRKSETLTDSQAHRYAGELFPAIEELVSKYKFSHLLDLNCGAGGLLIHLAARLKNAVGVGIGSDGALTRRANASIAAAQLEKRLITVPGNPLEVLTNTRTIFDRIGISRQLWTELDCLIATSIFSESSAKDSEARTEPSAVGAVTKVLAAIPKNFPNCHLLLIEPTASARFEKNYYAPELTLLMRLCRISPWTPEQWRNMLKQSGLSLVEETPLTTDGLTLFLCKPA